MNTKYLIAGLLVIGLAQESKAEEVFDENSDEFSVEAQEEESQYGWRAKLNKASLAVTSTHVDNAKEYRNSPNSKLSGDSETVTKGVFDFALEYDQPDYLWTNSLFAEYGKTKLKPVDGPDVTSENSDKILLSTDYARKVWKYGDADVGPFVNLAYQTEFEPNDGAPRTKIIRGMGGIKMFEGKYIKSLYGAALGEYDFTYSDEVSKYGYEIGLKAEYPLREGVKFDIDTYYRDYIDYSRYQATDFEYEFSATGRMMVSLYKDFAFGPYIEYFQAKDRGSRKEGSSTIIGVAVDYSGAWKL